MISDAAATGTAGILKFGSVVAAAPVSVATTVGGGSFVTENDRKSLTIVTPPASFRDHEIVHTPLGSGAGIATLTTSPSASTSGEPVVAGLPLHARITVTRSSSASSWLNASVITLGDSDSVSPSAGVIDRSVLGV